MTTENWVAQGSPEWIRERIGHLTASRMADAMAIRADKKALCVINADGEIVEKLGNGQRAEAKAAKLRAAGQIVECVVVEPGEEYACRRDYKVEVLQERLTDLAVERFVSDAMQWGIDHEAQARAMFEEHLGVIVRPMGFVKHREIEFFGASPDGLVRPREGLEIKCPTSAVHISTLLSGRIPEDHKPQMAAQALVCGFDRVHFVSFDPRMTEERHAFFHRIYEPTEVELLECASHAIQFLKEVDAMWEVLHA